MFNFAKTTFLFNQTRHTNVLFTSKKEINNKPSFLDVYNDSSEINHIENIFSKAYYRKRYYKKITGLLTNCKSFTTYGYKVSFAKALTNHTDYIRLVAVGLIFTKIAIELTLIWVEGVILLPPPPFGFPLITQKR